jgi:hypothetical protein
MTATIAPPPDVPFLVRSDPRVRLDDYVAALRFYLTVPDDAIDRIVFVDNSASDVTALQHVVDERTSEKDVELISYWGLDYPIEQGRSVGETHLLANALERSRILGALAADDVFWKVTGRLRIRNIARLVRSTPGGCALYIDLRRYPRRWVDTRVFAATSAGFHRSFMTRIETLRHDLLPPGMVAPEERLFGELVTEREREGIAARFRVEPLIEGSSGFGEDYRRPRRRLQSAVRTVSRRVVPALWI